MNEGLIAVHARWRNFELALGLTAVLAHWGNVKLAAELVARWRNDKLAAAWTAMLALLACWLGKELVARRMVLLARWVNEDSAAR